MEPRRSWNDPLSVRQLVLLMLIATLVAMAAITMTHNDQRISKDRTQSECLANAPLGWDCTRDPTGYPR